MSFVDGRPYCSNIPDELAEIAFLPFPESKGRMLAHAAAVEARDWEEQSLRKSWGLVLKTVTRVRVLLYRIAQLVRTLEEPGLESFDETPTPGSWGPSA